MNSAPAHVRPGEQVTCTTSRVAPGLDTLWALGSVVGGLVAYRANEEAGYLALAAAGGLLYGLSAGHGFKQASKCAAVIETSNRIERLREERRDRAEKRREREKREAAPTIPLGCQYDTQCKGERVCIEGKCVRDEHSSAEPVTEPTAPEPSTNAEPGAVVSPDVASPDAGAPIERSP